MWRDLKFFLVDRWKGMAVYEGRIPQAPARWISTWLLVPDTVPFATKAVRVRSVIPWCEAF